MQIVIEIPEQRYVEYENDTVHTFAERAILQGTPLEQIFDEIKKEINDYIDKEKLTHGGNFDHGLNCAIQIIDRYKNVKGWKHGSKHKTESEDV